MTEPASTPQGANSQWSSSDLVAAFAERVAKAFELRRSGQSEQALGLAKEAERLAVRFDPPHSPETARAFNSLGVIFFESGYLRSALSAYERSLAIIEQLEPPDEDLRAALHNNLGQVCQGLGRLAEAQAALENAVAIRRRISADRLDLGVALDNLASVLGQRGDLDAAEAMHGKALEIFEPKSGPFDTHVATALGNLSNIYQRRHDFLRAEAFRLRALDAHERVLGLAAGETLLDLASLANLYRDKRDDARADALMNLLLSIGGDQPGPEHRNLANMLFDLAKSAFGAFRLDLAERLGARAVALLEASEGPNAPDTLQVVHQLANVRHAMGDLEAAERAYHRAQSGFATLQMHDEALAALIDLGKLYRDRGAYDVAGKLLTEALDRLRSRPESDRQAIASVLGNLGLVHYEAERYGEADAAFIEALSEAEEGGAEYGERPWLLHNRGMLKYHLGDYDTACPLYEEAKRLWIEQRGEDDPFVATTAANLASLHWARGDNTAALAFFAEAERLRDHQMARTLTVGSERQRAAYAHSLQADLHQVVTFCLALHPLPIEVSRFAAQMLLRRKGRVLDAVAHTFLQLHESIHPEDQVLANRLQTVRQAISGLMAPALVNHRPVVVERERLADLRAEEERLEAELSYRGALFRPGLEPVVLEDFQRCLPPDGALIELLRCSEFDPTRTGKKGPWKEARYAAVVVTPAGEPRWFDLGSAAMIDERCDQWCSLLRSSSTLVEEDRRHGQPEGQGCSPLGDFFSSSTRNEKAAALYQLLIAPLSDALSGARHLLIAPDGKLVLMPFGELRDADGRTLTDRFLVSYLSCGRDLARAVTAEESTGGVVVIAAPDFDAEPEAIELPLAASNRFSDREGFAPLPGARDEAEEIGRLLGSAQLLLGPAATVDALRHVRQPIVLHVATHGFFAPLEDEVVSQRLDWLSLDDGPMLVQRIEKASLINPMFCSGLALCGANHRGAGIITAQEIAGLDLRGTELVVLSACETGLGTVKQGEEFTGLRRALAIAGAMTQLTSLWKVDDDATRALMGHYYRLLLDGYGRAEALQRAQSRVAEDPAHPEWRHPAYWAAFVLAGAWGPLRRRLTARARSAADPA